MSNSKKKRSPKETHFLVFRVLIRLLFAFSFFGMPDLTEKIWGVEIELESEAIALICILITGTFWCGWFCPFGHVQAWSSKFGNRIAPKLQISIPPAIDSKLRYLKYVFLIAFLIVFITGTHGYFDDHYQMYQSTVFSKIYLAFKKPWAIFLIPFFIPRFFCKYVCYQKAGYQIMNKIAPFLAIKRNTSSCIGCKRCTKACPMGIDVAESESISGGECIGCLTCVQPGTCPPKVDAMELTWFKKRVPVLAFSIITVIIYLTLTITVLLKAM